MRMLKKYSVSVLAASVMASLSFTSQANNGLEIVDLGTLPEAYVTFPGGMNEYGEAVVVNRNLWQQNIRFDLLVGDEAFEDFDFDNLSRDDYRRIRNILNNPAGFAQDPAYQKLANQISHFYDGQVNELTGFDVIDPDTNRYTDSVNYVANDVNSSRVIVGQAGEPYRREWTTDQEGNDVQYFMRDTFPRGFVYRDGQVTFLTGESDTFQGGSGNALALNERNQIVGFAAFQNIDGLNNRINFCIEGPTNDEGEPTAANEALEVCVWRYWYANEVRRVADGFGRTPIFTERAYMWTLEEDGSVTTQQLGGFMREFPEPSDPEQEQREPVPLASRAVDVNASGIAVGAARRFVTYFNGAENIDVMSSVAFRDGDIIPLQSEFRTTRSEATAINDNNIVVGFSLVNTGSANRQRAYWVDLDNLEAGRTYPSGFFSTSAWRPRAINNHNVMVGRAEATAELGIERPTVGFRYDIDNEQLVDLNHLLPCNSGYRVVDAYDINDNGDILALATTDVTIDIDGNADTQERLRIIRLQSSGEAGCGPQDNEVVRQGASISPVSVVFMTLLTLLITVRRMKRR